MPGYLETINRLLVREAARHPELLQFGENIAQGSRLCGVARSLSGRVLTVGNCENTHVGVGLGMMLEGGAALLIVKQLDFLLLSLDQMVNTMNLVRAARPDAPEALGSFTILTIVCDQGWQGPQSSFNDLAGVCSLARVDGYFLNGAADSERVLGAHLVRPGFRILAVSQRRFGEEVIAQPVLSAAGDGEACLRYASGPDVTIAAFGFALPAALAQAAALEKAGKQASVFSVNPVQPYAWNPVVASAARSRRLLVLDDGKGPASLAHHLVSMVLRAVPDCHTSVETREHGCEWAVNEDQFAAVAAGVVAP